MFYSGYVELEYDKSNFDKRMNFLYFVLPICLVMVSINFIPLQYDYIINSSSIQSITTIQVRGGEKLESEISDKSLISSVMQNFRKKRKKRSVPNNKRLIDKLQSPKSAKSLNKKVQTSICDGRILDSDRALSMFYYCIMKPFLFDRFSDIENLISHASPTSSTIFAEAAFIPKPVAFISKSNIPRSTTTYSSVNSRADYRLQIKKIVGNSAFSKTLLTPKTGDKSPTSTSLFAKKRHYDYPIVKQLLVEYNKRVGSNVLWEEFLRLAVDQRENSPIGTMSEKEVFEGLNGCELLRLGYFVDLYRLTPEIFGSDARLVNPGDFIGRKKINGELYIVDSKSAKDRDFLHMKGFVKQPSKNALRKVYSEMGKNVAKQKVDFLDPQYYGSRNGKKIPPVPIENVYHSIDALRILNDKTEQLPELQTALMQSAIETFNSKEFQDGYNQLPKNTWKTDITKTTIILHTKPLGLFIEDFEDVTN